MAELDYEVRDRLRMADVNMHSLWKEAMIQLQNDLGEEEVGVWVSIMKYLRFEEAAYPASAGSAGEGKLSVNCIVIGVPANFHRNKIKDRYQNNIISNLKKLTGKEFVLKYEITGNSEMVKESHSKNTDKKTKSTSSATVTISNTEKKKGKHPQMRDDFTFDRYVIGENNSFAANAAIAISKNPGKTYNPFLIFGGVGLGKTHLMQAIGNYIHYNSNDEVIYVTSEDFLNEYLESLSQGKMKAFKNKFRYPDVLLIDDIQFFQDKPGVQEELFHTFNALINSKKQLVFSSDRPPDELKKFSERLISRFGQGLKLDLQPPRYEERYNIIKSTLKNKGTSIPDEVIDLLSKNISSNIRDLISALNTLIAYIELVGKPITLEVAQQQLKSNFFAPKKANLSMDIIMRVVADYFGLTPNDLKGKKRSQNIVFARQLAMFIARELTEYSTTEIGQDFGGKDHTTVMHSIGKIKGKFITDPTLESTIDKIKQNIKEFSAKY